MIQPTELFNRRMITTGDLTKAITAAYLMILSRTMKESIELFEGTFLRDGVSIGLHIHCVGCDLQQISRVDRVT